MSRKLTFHIFRYTPLDPSSQPHLDDFHLEETDSLTIFIALNQIREEQDPSLQFDFCCRAGICGSCAMLINGRLDLACHTKTKDLPDEITLLPLPVFKLIGDLSVDTGSWFRAMNEKVESWIHTDKVFDPTAEEERMENHLAEELYEGDPTRTDVPAGGPSADTLREGQGFHGRDLLCRRDERGRWCEGL